MRAKEYMELYKGKVSEKDIDMASAKIVKMLVDEVSDLMDKRGSSENALIGILNEIDNKWKSINTKKSLNLSGLFRETMMRIDSNVAKLAGWSV